MPSRCQTLSEYIKRRQQAQDLKLAKFDTSSSLGTDKQFTELITAKKEKVHLILNEILNQVKKTDQTKDHLSTIETMIANAQRQIDFQFQHICTQVYQKLRHKEHLYDSKQDQRSQSSIDKRLKDKEELKKQVPNVLRQVRTENNMVDSKQERQRIRQKNEIQIRKKRQNKEDMNLKENQVKQVNLKNPEQDYSEKSLFYTFNGLGKDRKQLPKPSKVTKPSKISVNRPSN